MKFSTALTLALAGHRAMAEISVKPFFADYDFESSHAWCCTDAKCPESCDIYNTATGETIDVDTNAQFVKQCYAITADTMDEIGEECYDTTPGDFYLYAGGLLPCCHTPNYFKEFSYNQVFGDPSAAAMYCNDLFFFGAPTFGYQEGECRRTIIGGGDPHFKRWNGEWFDFHGECDLNFIHAPNFGKGLGMDITIRTKQRHGYSFIESAAMKIGDDILEVSSWADYKLNGVASADLSGAHLGPFEIVYEYINEKEQKFTIKTEGTQTIQMKTFKDWVDVKLDSVSAKDFDGSTGMMGSFPTGAMIARDGVTAIEDPNEYAAEWQVRAEDPQLFTLLRAPQHPVQCIIPSDKQVEQRRLGENGVSQEDAAKACEHLDEEHKDMCIFDVVATGDLEYASAGTY